MENLLVNHDVEKEDMFAEAKVKLDKEVAAHIETKRLHDRLVEQTKAKNDEIDTVRSEIETRFDTYKSEMMEQHST